MVKTLSVIIVGSGLGGLAAAIALKRAGHNVTVLEGAKELSEVGAGIQVPPNASRIFDAWGLLGRFNTKVVSPGSFDIRRYSTGEIIGTVPLKLKMIEQYGYPYLLVHRADYLQILYEASIEIGVKIVLDARVNSVDDSAVAVRLANGSVYSGDLILGADGIRSNVRAAVIPDETVLPKKSSSSAYRATVPGQVILSDPEISHLMDNLSTNCWIGYRCHIVAYPIRCGDTYNLVMIHPAEEAAVSKWNKPGDLDEMKNHYRKFDPVVQKVLMHVTSCSKWPLAVLSELSCWVSPSGKVALVGDAAHAMLPYFAQGAAQAIEDGATLGILFSQIKSVDEIPDLLKLYERIRKPRVERIQKLSLKLGKIWHLPDGNEQIARDKAIKLTLSENTQQNVYAKNSNQRGDSDLQSWLFGHDAIYIAKKALNDKLNEYYNANLRKRASL